MVGLGVVAQLCSFSVVEVVCATAVESFCAFVACEVLDSALSLCGVRGTLVKFLIASRGL